MALSSYMFLFWAVCGACIMPAYGTYFNCPNTWDGSGVEAFDCPRSYETYDEMYCCNAGSSSQYCCDYDDYYDIYYFSSGAIIAAVVGSIILLSLIVTCIVVCCVCCARAPPRHPATTHVITTTTAHTAENPAPIMTVNAPPGYYTPSPVQAPPKVGQYGQFQNEPSYPIN